MLINKYFSSRNMLTVKSQHTAPWSQAQRNKAGKIQMSASFRLPGIHDCNQSRTLIYTFQALWLGNAFTVLILLPLLIHHRFRRNRKSCTYSEHKRFTSSYQITLGILWELSDSLRTICPCLETSIDQQSINSPPFIKHRKSLPYSKQRVTTHCSEANKIQSNS